jgi:hypothetical protein
MCGLAIKTLSPEGRLMRYLRGLNVLAGLIGAIIFAAVPSSAKAQYDIRQCTWMIEQITQAIESHATNQIISLERQNLEFCKERMPTEEYANHLGILASGLEDDGQHQDSLAVANRCLQIDAAYLPCFYRKANALTSLMRFREAKLIIDKSSAIAAISPLDVAVQRKLRKLSVSVNATLNSKPATATEDIVAAPVAARQMANGVAGSVLCWGSSVDVNVDIQGEITAATVESVSKLLDQFHEQQRKVESGSPCDKSGLDISGLKAVNRINSIGGSINAAMALGRLLRKERMSLDVAGVCFSACVLVLAGAVERNVGTAGKVGIHRPYFGTTPEKALAADQIKEAYLQGLQEMRAYLREVHVPQRLADDMLAVEPENNRILTEAELKSYRLAGVDADEQQTRAVAKEATDIQEANRMNLDRREYTHRKALVARECLRASNYDNCYAEVMRTGKEP